MSQRPVRVRMAPSPTGSIHVGSARTALFNFLFARRHGGTFILRIDDTDVERSLPEYIEPIFDGFRWLGLEWDEGPTQGGPHAPYFQSSRLDIYRSHADRLVSEGRAYHCFCTQQELDAERRAAEAGRRPFVYSRRCLTDPPSGRSTSTIRLRIPTERIVIHDLIRGEVEFDSALIGDPIIVKSDGYPTYNFASPIDDALMGITHVIRGEEHLPNTPVQVLILKALDLPLPDAFAHIPLILAPDRTKLSKRRHPALITQFREWGYLPEAMVNYLALLGWNPGTEQEIFSLAELEATFDLGRVQRSGAIFDTTKLDWINGHYIRTLDTPELGRRLAAFVPRLPAALLPVAAAGLRERMARLDEATAMLDYVWKEGYTPDPNPGAAEPLRAAASALEAVGDWSPEPIEAALAGVLETLGMGRGKLFGHLRAAVTGQRVAPPIHYTLALLPKETAIDRLRRAAG